MQTDFQTEEDPNVAALVRRAMIFQYASDRCAAIRNRMAAVADELRAVAGGRDELLRLARDFDNRAAE